MKYLVSIILAVFLIVNNHAFAATNLDSYFPTGISDRWEFVDESSPLLTAAVEITGDTLINGVTYLIFQEFGWATPQGRWFKRCPI